MVYNGNCGGRQGPPQRRAPFPKRRWGVQPVRVLDGLVPGCTVELRIGATVVGNGIADSDGNLCVGADLKNAAGEAGQTLSARMFVCGQAGQLATTPLLKDRPCRNLLLAVLFLVAKPACPYLVFILARRPVSRPTWVISGLSARAGRS